VAQHVERGERLGARAAARGVREGVSSGTTQGRRARARPVSSVVHIGLPGGDVEREGGREEAGGWAGPWDGPHPSAERGERERGWQVGPAKYLIKFEIVQTV
jgi:hypothetical protein